MNTNGKVVVTGGAGFIGMHLVQGLKDEGYEVAVVDIKQESDVRKTDELKNVFKDVQYVFHLAALPRVQFSIEHPQETNDTNVSGTLSVLEAARAANVKRVIYASSSSVYGDSDILPLVESLPASPKSPYALQKYIGELYAKLYSSVFGLSTVSLRYFNVYGPGADPEGAYPLVVAKFIKLRSEGKPLSITGDGTQTRDFTNVRDVVRANILAATSEHVGKGEAINIGAGNNVSVNKIAEMIGGEVAHIAPRLEPHDTRADNTLAKKLLGWEPQVSLEEGIAELKKIAGIA